MRSLDHGGSARIVAMGVREQSLDEVMEGGFADDGDQGLGGVLREDAVEDALGEDGVLGVGVPGGDVLEEQVEGGGLEADDDEVEGGARIGVGVHHALEDLQGLAGLLELESQLEGAAVLLEE